MAKSVVAVFIGLWRCKRWIMMMDFIIVFLLTYCFILNRFGVIRDSIVLKCIIDRFDTIMGGL